MEMVGRDYSGTDKMDERFKGVGWDFKTSISNEKFDGFDFSETDFNHPVFDRVEFNDCVFVRSILNDARTYGCVFRNCSFLGVDLRTITLGARGGIFEKCKFDKCDFRGGMFFRPEFIGCSFSNCKWKGVDFKASYLERCKFSGKLQDVVFRGRYTDDLTEGARFNSMTGVDFSSAILGEYVAFDDCDLSSAIPPKGTSFEVLLKKSELRSGNYLITVGSSS